MFRFDITVPWKEFLNQNAKWCVGFTIRIVTIMATVVVGFSVITMQFHSSHKGATSDNKKIITSKVENESPESKTSFRDEIERLHNLKSKLEEYLEY